MSELPKGWDEGKLEDMLDYIQPTKFIVKSTEYNDIFKTPVLTAGKSFIKGYTNETEGIFVDHPVIIFDDFTTATKFVDFPFKVKSSAMKILRPTHELVNIKFVFYFMQTLRENTDTHKRYWISIFSKLLIPLPSLPEQRRIVAKIEELFSRLDAGVAALHHAKAQLQRYRQSVLAAAVTGQLTQAWREQNQVCINEWVEKTIGDIAKVQTGKTPKRNTEEFWKDGKIPWLTSSATNNTFTHKAEQFVTQVALDNGLKLFKPGTILLAMYGEGKTRGQITEITFEATCNQACAAILVNEEKVLRSYVKLRLEENYEETRKAASGGNQPNLNLTKVREIPITLPSLPEQQKIIAEVESHTTAIDRLEAELDRQITRSNRLRQSTLASAFAGRI